MSVITLREFGAEVDSTLRRKEEGIELSEEAEQLAGSLYDFTVAAWDIIMPRPLSPTWHVRTLCEHIQAAYEREIPRLAVTIQPGALKSTILSVMAPAWRWTHKPEERLLTASWGLHLSQRDAVRSRTLIASRWYQARWHVALAKDENLKTRYSNDQAGHRVATYVGGGTGDRGAVLQLDDPHNAQEASSETKADLEAAVEWWSTTWRSRMDDLVDDPGVIIVIGQRIHQDDLIGHVLASGDWTHLCLPTLLERKHPVLRGRYPKTVRLPSGKVIQGDPRTEEAELLQPTVQTREMLDDMVSEDGLTAHVFAGQFQQRPAPREGKLLKRADWRYYDPMLSFYRQRDGAFGPDEVAELASRAGAFTMIVHSWDTSVKDRKHSDFVGGGVWGCVGAQRFLLRLYHERAALNATIEAMTELSRWALALWPEIAHFVVIENSANGPEAAQTIRKGIQGVVLAQAKGSKWERAEAAEPALVGHNCFLPGYPNDQGDTYDPRTPQAVQEFVEELAAFDQGAHDDQVDQWSSMVNWTRKRSGTATISTPSGQTNPPRFLTPQGPQATRLRPGMRS